MNQQGHIKVSVHSLGICQQEPLLRGGHIELCDECSYAPGNPESPWCHVPEKLNNHKHDGINKDGTENDNSAICPARAIIARTA